MDRKQQQQWQRQRQRLTFAPTEGEMIKWATESRLSRSLTTCCFKSDTQAGAFTCECKWIRRRRRCLVSSPRRRDTTAATSGGRSVESRVRESSMSRYKATFCVRPERATTELRTTRDSSTQSFLPQHMQRALELSRESNLKPTSTHSLSRRVCVCVVSHLAERMSQRVSFERIAERDAENR